MSRRIQCRALLLALALGSAHAASPALHAASVSRRPASSVDRRLPSENFLLPFLIRFVDRFPPLGRTELKNGTTALPPTPIPINAPLPQEGPVLDPDGKPKG